MLNCSAKKVFGFLALTAVLAQAPAQAALLLTINSATTDQLSLSISGTFDAATVGDSPGFLAIKNNWSANVGSPTEMFSSTPVASTNTIMIGGIAPTTTQIQDGISTWMDNVYFVNPLGDGVAIAAGTVVSGTIVLDGIGAFNPAALSTLQLVSGFNRPAAQNDWARFEGEAVNGTVPVPGSAALVLLAGFAGFLSRRR